MNLNSHDGLYKMYKLGIMNVHYLWKGRDEFQQAINWNTALIDGDVRVIDEKGLPARL